MPLGVCQRISNFYEFQAVRAANWSHCGMLFSEQPWSKAHRAKDLQKMSGVCFSWEKVNDNW